MAEDYLTDDEQWEAVKRWIVENGLWVAGGVVLGVALLFGWRHYQSQENETALRASAQFGEMTSALDRNDRTESRRVALGLIKDFPKSPYADQAQLALARLAVDDGQLAGAIAPLTQVMNDSKDTELRRIARLRLARVLTDQGKPDEAIKTLADEISGAFAARAHEVRGDAFYAKKDFKAALTEYQAALTSDTSNSDAGLLELKIADLGASPAPAGMLPAGVTVINTPAAASTNKAKP